MKEILEIAFRTGGTTVASIIIVVFVTTGVVDLFKIIFQPNVKKECECKKDK